MSEEKFSFESMDALGQAISALQRRRRDDDQPQPSSVEINLEHSAEMAELSATTTATTEISGTDDGKETEGDSCSVSLASGEDETDYPDVSDVDGIGEDAAREIFSALDELGGFATSRQISEEIGQSSNRVSTNLSKLYYGGAVSRTPDESVDRRQYIYILE